jgi:hypothetical protein
LYVFEVFEILFASGHDIDHLRSDINERILCPDVECN